MLFSFLLSKFDGNSSPLTDTNWRWWVPQSTKNDFFFEEYKNVSSISKHGVINLFMRVPVALIHFFFSAVFFLDFL